MASDGCQVRFLSNFSPDTFVAADVLFSASIWVTPWKNHYHIFKRKLYQHISGCHPILLTIRNTCALFLLRSGSELLTLSELLSV